MAQHSLDAVAIETTDLKPLALAMNVAVDNLLPQEWTTIRGKILSSMRNTLHVNTGPRKLVVCLDSAMQRDTV
ncbi:hypothetical protein ColLi_12208 [Colletotrichum liriopes]|uniref:Uncharacterized protein n=1 Tax=Colletotrichum liriopes TaxID=708192 RepID=A0AA37GZ64_9PEZI|nr:hypothetical protein ColLi_12208 [Colletotrichum liriopes]